MKKKLLKYHSARVLHKQASTPEYDTYHLVCVNIATADHCFYILEPVAAHVLTVYTMRASMFGLFVFHVRWFDYAQMDGAVVVDCLESTSFAMHLFFLVVLCLLTIFESHLVVFGFIISMKG